MGFGPNIQGIRVTGSLSGLTSIHTTTISATTLYGNGSNLTGISSSDNFVTGATMNSDTLELSRSGGLSNVTVDLSQFNNLWTQSGSSIFYDSGNVGIGTSDALYRLDVVASGGTGSFEDIARFRTIDSTDYLAFTNGISTDGSFNPVLRSFNNTNESTNFYVQSVIDPTVDTGGNPLIMLQGRVSSNPGNVSWSGVTTRPILRVRNNSTDLVQINADGNFGIATITPQEKLHVNGNTIISGTLNIGTLPTGTTVNNLGIDATGNVIVSTPRGNARVDNFYYQISNSVDTRPVFTDGNVTVGWDETGNDIEFTMDTAPGGTGDMRSLSYKVGGATENVFITTVANIYDLHGAGVNSGERVEVFVTAENDVTYPAYKIVVYNTGESSLVSIWIERITKN